jgi:hypothetical protein
MGGYDRARRTAFLGLGRWAPVLQFAIAAILTAILFILFMRPKGPPSVVFLVVVSFRIEHDG